MVEEQKAMEMIVEMEEEQINSYLMHFDQEQKEYPNIFRFEDDQIEEEKEEIQHLKKLRV
jgi:hypothetical protein